MENNLNFLSDLILKTDSYKITHWKQYPPGTQKIYSYFESRGGVYPEICFFGLQYILKKHLIINPERDDMFPFNELQNFTRMHFGQDYLNVAGWKHINDIHDGQLPLEIKAVPEGTIVPIHEILMSVENTCDECFWLPNYIETLLVQTWYPTTVATISWHVRQLIKRYLEDTGDPELLKFKLHDFGFRGASSYESAMIGGMAHLVNFNGTDTLAGVVGAQTYYHAEPDVGVSVPAAEHSTITTWGESQEWNAYNNMIKQYPNGIVSIVVDSYNVFTACDMIGNTLKSDILNRNGTVVIRPDSGNFLEVVPLVLEILWKHFGGITNNKGYKVLDNHIRIIQGDGMKPVTIELLLERLKHDKYSADNITFGMGGGLLQECNRDTQKFAFKCSATKRDNIWSFVYKHPITDPAKNSKAGRMKLVINKDFDGKLTTVHLDAVGEDILELVYKDGKLLRDQTFDDIRERARQP
jgi:nicotinamide phosphoribosyltransferase